VIVALASPRIASTLDEGLDKVRQLMAEASAQGAEIVCFPEAYLPGLRGQDFEVLPWDLAAQERVLKTVAGWSHKYSIAIILGLEKLTAAGRQIAAVVIDSRGQLQGYQTKNQLDPSEDQFYVPGILAGCSRSMGSSLASRFAMRAGAIRRRCAGPRRGERRLSFIRSSPVVIKKVSV